MRSQEPCLPDRLPDRLPPLRVGLLNLPPVLPKGSGKLSVKQVADLKTNAEYSALVFKSATCSAKRFRKAKRKTGGRFKDQRGVLRVGL